MNPLMASSVLPGVLGVFDAPRKAAFEALGADDGSGGALLEAILGVDRNSGVGKYGGVAAEMLLDPLNLVGAGAAKLGVKGINLAGKAMRAGKVADLGRDVASIDRLNAARRASEAATDARNARIPKDASDLYDLRPDAGPRTSLRPGSPYVKVAQPEFESEVVRRNTFGPTSRGPIDARDIRGLPGRPMPGQMTARESDELRRRAAAQVDARKRLPDDDPDRLLYKQDIDQARAAGRESLMAPRLAQRAEVEQQLMEMMARDPARFGLPPRQSLGQMLGPDAGEAVAASMRRQPGLREAIGRTGPDLNPELFDAGDLQQQLQRQLQGLNTPVMDNPLLRQLLGMGGVSATTAGAAGRMMNVE